MVFGCLARLRFASPRQGVWVFGLRARAPRRRRRSPSTTKARGSPRILPPGARNEMRRFEAHLSCSNVRIIAYFFRFIIDFLAKIRVKYAVFVNGGLNEADWSRDTRIRDCRGGSRRRSSEAPRRHGQAPRRGHRLEENRGSRQDRKSTRLNSSHQIISYAVFCLKKK